MKSSSLPSLTRVEQILLDIIIEGYIDLKSSTTTQGLTLDLPRAYPPAILSLFLGP